MNKGYKFESETDTEVVVKLVKYLYDKYKRENISFQKLIEMACSQLVKPSMKIISFSSFIISFIFRREHLHSSSKVPIIQVNCAQHGKWSNGCELIEIRRTSIEMI